jgi:DNA-directed RNA polymerase beta' subunit
VRTILVLTCALALGGCAIAQRIEAEKQAKELAERNKALIEQSKAAMADCNTNFPKGNPKIEVARIKCLNEAMAIRMPALGIYQDLVGAYLTDRMLIAEKIQNGKMTLTEGEAAIAQRWSEAVNQIEQRRNARTVANAQMVGAEAQQRAADAANTAAWAAVMEASQPAPSINQTVTVQGR